MRTFQEKEVLEKCFAQVAKLLKMLVIFTAVSAPAARICTLFMERIGQ